MNLATRKKLLLEERAELEDRLDASARDVLEAYGKTGDGGTLVSERRARRDDIASRLDEVRTRLSTIDVEEIFDGIRGEDLERKLGENVRAGELSFLRGEEGLDPALEVVDALARAALSLEGEDEKARERVVARLLDYDKVRSGLASRLRGAAGALEDAEKLRAGEVAAAKEVARLERLLVDKSVRSPAFVSLASAVVSFASRLEEVLAEDRSKRIGVLWPCAPALGSLVSSIGSAIGIKPESDEERKLFSLAPVAPTPTAVADKIRSVARFSRRIGDELARATGDEPTLEEFLAEDASDEPRPVFPAVPEARPVFPLEDDRVVVGERDPVDDASADPDRVGRITRETTAKDGNAVQAEGARLAAKFENRPVDDRLLAEFRAELATPSARFELVSSVPLEDDAKLRVLLSTGPIRLRPKRLEDRKAIEPAVGIVLEETDKRPEEVTP